MSDLSHYGILKTPVKFLKGVGERRALLLEKELGISTIGELIEYYPFRYNDRTKIYKISELNSEMSYVQVQGVIQAVEAEGTKYKRRLKAYLRDDTGVIELVWFNSVDYHKNRLHSGERYTVYGKPNLFGGMFSITHPEMESPDTDRSAVGMFFPVYHTSERMKKQHLGSREISDIVRTALEKARGAVPETLPAYMVEKYDMLPREEAIRAMHFPADARELERAKLRLKTEELLYLRLKMRVMHDRRQSSSPGFRFDRVGEHFNKLYHEALPFELTNAQKKVLREIHADLQSGHQMNRLLQGDVGSGKTAVAVLCMLLAIDNSMQACIMAPTEILARQHYLSISKMLEGQSLSIALLTGSMTKKEKSAIAERLESGEIDLLVGTHIIIQDYVKFRSLGLAVIDEQHRFGVYQRSVLWDKNAHLSPHILIMSATPIPRTLALTMYGDLDVSILDELPPGRTPISTIHAYEKDRSEVHFFILSELQKGHQAYIVYPLIEESERLDYRSVEEGFELVSQAFPAHRVGMVHGKLSADEKERVMDSFEKGETHILVATTVIEVGVNVPNASVMLIESSERFGLSQLHQLRGRVGRGAARSYCILMTGNKVSETSLKRIQTMCESTDGFFIAEQDLKLRGYGDMEGTAQSGEGLGLKLASLSDDAQIVHFVVHLTDQILSEDPWLSLPKNAILRNCLSEMMVGEKDWIQIS